MGWQWFLANGVSLLSRFATERMRRIAFATPSGRRSRRAGDAPLPERRVAACDIINLARNAKTDCGRQEAVKRVNDQSVLADLAKNDEAIFVRMRAVERVADQAVLVHVARTDTYGPVRTAAVKRVTDQSVLAEIAKEYRRLMHPDDASNAAVELVTDQSLLIDIAKNAMRDVAALARRRVKDFPKTE